ncbi:MAG: hypothetical protein PHH49_02690 [Candidatus Omnitrophica bacterium]|nr:hypothetical protein [Candidatus Omnitrophota bacterium]MDD5487856.1 hypothetical protein [Candidatus Omnitrophota bacterium]
MVEGRRGKGSVACRECGEERGKHNGRKVSCLCSGVLCGRCGKGRAHKPDPCKWDIRNGGTVHVPWSTERYPICDDRREKDTYIPDYCI